MKSLPASLILLGLHFFAFHGEAQTMDDAVTPELSVRSQALDVAGAFSNDGYRIRDGYWSGELEKGRPQFLQVNLFSGNEYWFCAAAAPPARGIAVSVYNEMGQPVDFLTYDDGPVAAAGVEPDTSGPYIIRIELLDGEKSGFCLLYTYK